MNWVKVAVLTACSVRVPSFDRASRLIARTWRNGSFSLMRRFVQSRSHTRDTRSPNRAAVRMTIPKQATLSRRRTRSKSRARKAKMNASAYDGAKEVPVEPSKRARGDLSRYLGLGEGNGHHAQSHCPATFALNLRQKFLANEVGSALCGHRRVTRSGHKSVGRIA